METKKQQTPPPKKILLVDDEPDVVALFKMDLERLGYQVGTAYNGVEAVLQVLDEGWDTIILDIQMPVLDGLSAFRLIQRIAPDTPVVMLTGKAIQQDMLDSVAMGAHTCLLKPVPLAKLRKILSQINSNHPVH